MGKREKHRQNLEPLVENYIASGNSEQLCAYLLANSNLPGQRGNLELANAFGDVVGERAANEAGREPLWTLCRDLSAIAPEDAPTNTAKEFLPFCGTEGLGALGAARTDCFGPALTALRGLARDPRWRMREAVVFGLQRLLVARHEETLADLSQWPAGEDPLEMRAAAAAVAEPALLSDPRTATAALQLHQDIFDRTVLMEERRSDDFRTLRKGLGYTISVVASALPAEGFVLLEDLATSPDPDLRWIARENLKKKRLTQPFPGRVASAQAILDQAN
jgi:hypothetical protein